MMDAESPFATLLRGSRLERRERPCGGPVGEDSMDNKHILAWVQVNNRRPYLKSPRFDKQ